MKTTQPLLDYLATCSENSLQSFELARLNDISNLRQQLLQQLAATVDEMIEADIQARLAQWVYDRRQKTRRSSRRGRRRMDLCERQSVLPLFPAADSAPTQFPALDRHDLIRVTKSPASAVSSPTPHRPKLGSAS
jgi:hypothetical protein